MNSRCIITVATGSHYLKGQDRLVGAMGRFSLDTDILRWSDCLPPGSPTHLDAPYAFKAHAFLEAQRKGYRAVIWCDASIVPARSMEPLWARIERDGYWISRNGFRNSEWTTEAAYPLLGITREENDLVEHVVAGAFGLDVQSEIGKAALSEYVRFAENGAFRGPVTGPIGVAHRHDQTALSVIAHRLGMQLTSPPDVFAYPPGDERTILLADGAY